jgi:hypothetical protein
MIKPSRRTKLLAPHTQHFFIFITHIPSAPTHRRVLPNTTPLVFSHIKKVSGFIYVRDYKFL